MSKIEDADKRVKEIDSLFTSIEKLFKKHWLLILILAFGALGYFLFTTMPDQNSSAVNNQGEKVIVDTVFVDKPTSTIDTVASDSTAHE